METAFKETKMENIHALISWIIEAYFLYLGTFPIHLIRIKAYAGHYIIFMFTNSENMNDNKGMLVNIYSESASTRISSVNI